MDKLARIPVYFTKNFEYWPVFDLFKKCLYIFLVLNTLSLLPIAKEVWDFHGIADFRGWNAEMPWYKQFSFAFTNILSHPATNTRPWIIWFFIGGQFLFFVFGFFNKLPRLSSFMIYFFSVNLFLKGSLLFTGGEVLISLLLFYMMFIQFTTLNTNSKGEEVRFSWVQSILNNTFFLACKIQICFVYFFSTLYKLLDPIWLKGEAMMYISRIDGYHNALFESLFANNPLVAATATYVSLGYQIIFPIVIWMKKLKNWVLLLGIIVHLSIAYGMGIFAFGIIMIIVYLLFIDHSQAEQIRKKLKMKKIKVCKPLS